jgi:predicted nuclease of predicted toxin-antitoxin system
MKLLFDENLSDRLVTQVADLFPGSVHVKQVNLAEKSDAEIWNFAKAHGYAIVSKDWDFHQLSLLYGFPPKVVYLNIGNSATHEILALLRNKFPQIMAFNDSPVESILIPTK